MVPKQVSILGIETTCDSTVHMIGHPGDEVLVCVHVVLAVNFNLDNDSSVVVPPGL
jgi:hypothetical protein